MTSGQLAQSRRGPVLPYPEGWFQVSYAQDVAPGQVVSLHYFGEELVMFRTESGVIQVMDAYCPHLGAHLARGGRVIGEHLRCPFHAWEYGVDGRCKHIPYSPTIPPNAKVGIWPTVERAGLVFVWHSSAGNPPYWDLPEFPEYGDPAWEGYSRHHWIIDTSIQEIAENAVDTGHLPAVHGGTMSEEAKFKVSNGIPPVDIKFYDHLFDVDLTVNHVSNEAHHTATYYGLGVTISKSTGKGARCFLTGRTPIDENQSEVRYSVLTSLNEPEDPTGDIARAYAQFTADEFEKDIEIWNNKIYRPRPLLCKNDGPIDRFRRWAKQFYPAEPGPIKQSDRPTVGSVAR
ncbi:MAG: hypothetical protein RL367_90 [Pseudomonadota bacterium]